MSASNAWLKPLAFVFLISSALEAAEGTCPAHLFIITRSKNTNIVAYDANPDKSGDIKSSEAVVAYWLLNGEKDKREELTRMERERAYGVETAPGDSPGTYSLVFKAQRTRPMTVRTLKDCLVVTTSIGGRNAILRKLYIQSKEGIALPKVEYVEFFGEDPDTGEPVYEKINPK
jgi:hypothetical protein